jgi:hypothetical protein
MDRWEVSPGLTATFSATFRDSDGNAITFAGTEDLGGSVWLGGTQSVLFTLAPTWSAAAAGTVSVAIPGTSTSALAAGDYRVILTVFVNGATADAFEAVLTVLAAPGTDTPGRTYCTAADVRRVAPWTERFINLDTGQGGFLEQRLQASQEIDDAIVANYRGAQVGQFGAHSLAAIDWDGAGGPRRSQIPSRYIREQLNAGALMGRSTDPQADRPQTARICALRAASLVGLAQIGIDNQAAALGAMFYDQYLSAMSAWVAELDINGDGLAEIAVHLGSTNPLFT